MEPRTRVEKLLNELAGGESVELHDLTRVERFLKDDIAEYNRVKAELAQEIKDRAAEDDKIKKSLSKVATSGSYNDLTDKPVIDTELSATSTNAVENKAVYAAIGDVEAVLKTLNSGAGA